MTFSIVNPTHWLVNAPSPVQVYNEYARQIPYLAHANTEYWYGDGGSSRAREDTMYVYFYGTYPYAAPQSLNHLWYSTAADKTYEVIQQAGGTLVWNEITMPSYLDSGFFYRDNRTNIIYRYIPMQSKPLAVFYRADVSFSVPNTSETFTASLTHADLYSDAQKHIRIGVSPRPLGITALNATITYYDEDNVQVWVGNGVQYESVTANLYGSSAVSTDKTVNGSISITKDVNYCICKDTDCTFTLTISPTLSKPASMVYPVNQSDCKYACECKIGWSNHDGTGYQVQSLEYAKRMGLVSVSSEYYSYNGAILILRFNQAYKYDVRFTVAVNDSDDTGSYAQDVIQSSQIIAYTKPTPKLQIDSVVPAIASSSGVAEDGYAPYAVTISDITTVSGMSGLIKTITWDMGDSGELDNTYIYDVASETSASYHKTNSHSYDGYSKRSIRLTYTSKDDIDYSGSVTFTPTQTQRIVIPSVLTVQGTDYPASTTIRDAGASPTQVVCKAYPAGNPVPYVEWETTVNTAVSAHASEYYQVKDGEYAEMSLPTPFGSSAQEGYHVKCSVWKDDTKSELIGSYTPETWSLFSSLNSSIFVLNTVNDTDIYSHLSPQDNHSVWVYDGAHRIDKVYPTRIQYCENWADNDYVEFDLPVEYAHLDMLTPGNVISVGYQGYARSMVVDEYNESEYSVTIVARDMASLVMSSRVATVSTNSITGNGYDYQIAPAESLLQYFPASNIITASRAQPQFRVAGKNRERGGKCVYSARYENIMDIVKEICSDSGMGFSSALYSESTSPIVCMWIREGRDLTSGTGRVVFEEKRFKTARVGNYRQFASSNVAVTAGVGIGKTRDYSEYGDTTAAGLSRREVFVDAGDSADADEQRRMGLLELIDAKQNSITVYPNLHNPSCVFGSDYRVGDKVNIVTKSGLELQKVITSARVSKDSTGVNLTLECGDDLKGYRYMIRQNKLQNAYARK